VSAYAERQGVDVDAFVAALSPVLTPDQAGKSILDIAITPHPDHRAYTLTSAGLTPLS
jgi:hypothetical protein